MMKHWSKDSKTYVAHMDANDFYGNEKSVNMPAESDFKIVLKTKNGKKIVLKNGLQAQKNEVLDATYMNTKALRNFYEKEIKTSQRFGQFVFITFESHYDESIRPYYVWTCR